MKYDDPKLRELLAGRYVLGTMPRLARARFDRLIARDAAFCAEVREWAEIFAPIDAAETAVAPPPRVWRAIEAQLGPAEPPRRAARAWFDSLWLWRGAAGFATAIAAALLIYVGVAGLRPAAPLPTVVAVLMDNSGAPAWIARSAGKDESVTVAALGRQTIDAGHSFQLWAIAGGGAPRPLGLLSPQPDNGLLIASSVVPPTGGVLAISLEPAGGSPTGQPTGPVLFQGKVFSNPL